MSENPPERLRFGPFVLNCSSLELSRDGEPVALAPQPAGVLALLASQPGRLYSHHEIQQHVWGERAVEFEMGLHTCIRQIRRALDDDPQKPCFIETVPRRGYRFMAQRAIAKPWYHQQRLIIGATIAAVVLVGGLAVWIGTVGRSANTPERITLVVLPFDSLLPEANSVYLADGFSEDIRAELSRLDPERLGVIARTSSLRYRKGDRSIQEIARELDVSYVIEGSVGQGTSGLQIAARLVRAADQTQVWADRFTMRRDQSADVALNVAGQVVKQLTPELVSRLGREPSKPMLDPTMRAAVFEARYLIGEGKAELAADRLQSAIGSETALAEPLALLAEARLHFGDYDGAEAAARSALDLNDTMALAHWARGEVELYGRASLESAGPWYRKAFERDPHDSKSLQGWGTWLLLSGRTDEAIGPLREALMWDPVSPLIRGDIPWSFFYARRYEEALVQSRRSLGLLPELQTAVHCQLWIALVQGNHDAALPLIRQILEGRNADTEALSRFDELAPQAAIEQFYISTIERLSARNPPPYTTLARYHTLLDQRDEALNLLKKAVEAKDSGLLYARVDPRFDRLRGDPRFAAILRF